MTSAELLYRIRQRNGLCPVIWNTSENPITENSELLANIRNFISFGAEMENKATTQEIIDKSDNNLMLSRKFTSCRKRRKINIFLFQI